MSVVLGQNVLITVLNNGEWFPFACFRSVTFNMTSETIGKSTIGSGDWKEKEVTALDWNFSCEGVPYFLKPDMFDVSFLTFLWITKKKITIHASLTDRTETATMLIEGDALINNISINGAVNNPASVSFSGEGTGELKVSGPQINMNALMANNTLPTFADNENLIIHN